MTFCNCELSQDCEIQTLNSDIAVFFPQNYTLYLALWEKKSELHVCHNSDLQLFNLQSCNFDYNSQLRVYLNFEIKRRNYLFYIFYSVAQMGFHTHNYIKIRNMWRYETKCITNAVTRCDNATKPFLDACTKGCCPHHTFLICFSLVCAVSYTTQTGEKLYFRKFFKFQVSSFPPPLSHSALWLDAGSTHHS